MIPHKIKEKKNKKLKLTIDPTNTKSVREPTMRSARMYDAWTKAIREEYEKINKNNADTVAATREKLKKSTK